jgi:hypothetical protein
MRFSGHCHQIVTVRQPHLYGSPLGLRVVGRIEPAHDGRLLLRGADPRGQGNQFADRRILGFSMPGDMCNGNRGNSGGPEIPEDRLSGINHPLIVYWVLLQGLPRRITLVSQTHPLAQFQP